MSLTVHDPARRMQRLTAVPAGRAMLAFAIACLTLILPATGSRAFAQAAPQAPAALAAPPAQTTGTARATSVNGSLLPAGYHYLGLEPTLTDGTVVLTIALEPADEEDLRGAINFLVLTDDGLRRVLAGADPFDLDIAASAPLQFDPIGNKYQAVFKASGKGPYTVIVYNSGGKIGGYTLTALNSVLLDDDSQVNVVAAAPAPLNPPTLEASTTPTETMEARVSITKGSPMALSGTAVTDAAPSVNALRLSGLLDPALSRHFLNVQPDTRDGTVGIDMVYEPRGQETDGLVNFYVLDQDALRRFVYGEDFDSVELAAGSPKPFSPNSNDLVGGFTASGDSEYTVVPFSVAPLTVTYVMSITGGQLIDRYGQTNEAAAARAEFEALSAAADAAAGATSAGSGVLPASVPVTSAVPAVMTSTTAVPGGPLALAGADSLSLTDLVPASADAVIGTPEAADGEAPLMDVLTNIEGTLPTPYSHNYWSLIPTIRDGVVVLTLDYAPRDQEALKGNINFIVVDEDGMRRIVSGGRPEDYGLAGGAEVKLALTRASSRLRSRPRAKARTPSSCPTTPAFPLPTLSRPTAPPSWPPAPTANWCRCCRSAPNESSP